MAQIHAAGQTGGRSPGLDAAIAAYLDENPPAGGGGASALNDLTDVDTTGQTTGDVLKYNGTSWVADADSAGTVTSTDISDSTAIGRDVLTAADAATARSAIGAGTSSFSGAYGDLSGTPTLGDAAAKDTGTTAGTVAAGDHLHDARYVTVVEHGAVAGTARPAGATVVLWIGSVEPTNAVAGDQWDDASGSPSVYIEEPASDGTNGQVLTTDGAGGRSWTTVGGGSDPWTYYIAPSDTSSGEAGATVDVTGLAATDLPDGLYEYKVLLVATSLSTGCGVQPGMVAPTGCTVRVLPIGPNAGNAQVQNLATMGITTFTASSFTFGSLNAPNAGNPFVAGLFQGTVRAASMSGDLKVTVKSELTGAGTSVTAKADSYMKIRRIGD